MIDSFDKKAKRPAVSREFQCLGCEEAPPFSFGFDQRLTDRPPHGGEKHVAVGFHPAADGGNDM